MERILVIGANGQIGSELVEALAEIHGEENVIAGDIGARSLAGAQRYETLDVLDSTRLAQVIARDYPYSTFSGSEVAKIIRARRVE